MGIQKAKNKMLPHHHRNGTQAGEDRQVDAKNVWVLSAGLMTLPFPQQQQRLKPVKTGRRRRGHDHQEERARGEGDEEVEEAVTPKGEACRIPADAETCPPAPKKPRTAVLIRDSHRCNCDGEAIEFFRVPVDLEAVFATLAAKTN